MFSVIIPLYNKAETIERAVASVLAQTERTFELIVVDDGSSDCGAEIVRSIPDPRIRLIRQANGGVSSARNTGIEASKYEYVTFLDADDEYLPEFLKTIRKLIEKYPQAGIYGTSYCFQYPDGTRKNPLIRGIPDHFEGILENYFEIASSSAPVFCSDTVCIKREVLLNIGKFPVGVASGEDLLTWTRICASYPLAYQYTPLARYILTYTPHEIKRCPDAADIVGSSLVEILKEKSQVHFLRKYVSYYYRGRGRHALECDMLILAAKALFKSLFYDPFNYKAAVLLMLVLLPRRIRNKLVAFR